MKILYVADTYEIGGAFLAFIDLIGDILEKHQDITPIILTSKQGKNNEFYLNHDLDKNYMYVAEEDNTVQKEGADIS